MIYTIRKEEQTFEIDDCVFFDKQANGFKEFFLSLRQGDIAEFDNASVTLLSTGRVIITIKEEEGENE